jgi:RNA polymerase sigma-70 factor (ECF subfamily)
METGRAEVSVLLSKSANGDQAAPMKLSTIIYGELRQLARAYMRRERLNHTLQATALVHEAYLKLVKSPVDYQSRSHFFRVAARAMRRVLINHAKYRNRGKGPGRHEVHSLDEAPELPPARSDLLLKLVESLKRLSKIDPQQVEIVEMRYFGGLSLKETGDLLGVSPSTVKRDWNVAKAWLFADMRQSHDALSGRLGGR